MFRTTLPKKPFRNKVYGYYSHIWILFLSSLSIMLYEEIIPSFGYRETGIIGFQACIIIHVIIMMIPNKRSSINNEATE